MLRAEARQVVLQDENPQELRRLELNLDIPGQRHGEETDKTGNPKRLGDQARLPHGEQKATMISAARPGATGPLARVANPSAAWKASKPAPRLRRNDASYQAYQQSMETVKGAAKRHVGGGGAGHSEHQRAGSGHQRGIELNAPAHPPAEQVNGEDHQRSQDG